jgi:hypothetical protein
MVEALFCKSEKNAETLIDASNEVDLEVKAEKTKFLLLSCCRSAGQNDKKS